MRTSPAGIALICRFEGCKLDAYRDSVGVETIGYGHTGAGVSEGLHIDQARAEQLLASDLVTFECQVSSAVRVPLSQNQFDSLVSLSFNIGAGAFRNSSLLKRLNGGDYRGAASEFGRWVHAGAEVSPGLVARRASEQAMFNGQNSLEF